MAALLPASAKRKNKSRFCTAKAFIRNNNGADRLRGSWFAIEKQENERNVRDPDVCSRADKGRAMKRARPSKKV